MAKPLPILEAASETFRIGDLARRSHKSARAVRLYEEKGLLGRALRTEGGHRIYSEAALERLAWIDKLKILGLSLADIRAFLDELAEANTAPDAMARARGMFSKKLDEVRTQIAALRELEMELHDGVAYLDACQGCAPSTQPTACSSCGQPHPVEAPPIVLGLHQAEGTKV